MPIGNAIAIDEVSSFSIPQSGRRVRTLSKTRYSDTYSSRQTRLTDSGEEPRRSGERASCCSRCLDLPIEFRHCQSRGGFSGSPHPSVDPRTSVGKQKLGFLFGVHHSLRRGRGDAIGLDRHLPIELHKRFVEQSFMDDACFYILPLTHGACV